ncbi:unnamed protein product [Toxocara canis]|uniref:Myosin heavy chain n=1 Tax=Toxocara canis TaxID=6265 RepID=A0A183V9H9_TOXCA|nr:unnamed protein product [Toxocara canis]
MREQEEAAMRLTREQEKEVNQLRQEVNSANEEICNAERSIGELTEKLERAKSAKVHLQKSIAVRDEALSLLEDVIVSLRTTVLGRRDDEAKENRADWRAGNDAGLKSNGMSSDEECLQKAHRLASDLDAIHRKALIVAQRMGGKAKCDGEYVGNRLEKEFRLLKERCAQWKNENERLRKGKLELRKKIDEAMPVVQRTLDTLSSSRDALQQQLQSANYDSVDSSCAAIKELVDEVSKQLDERSLGRLSRKRATAASALSAAGDGRKRKNDQQLVESWNKVVQSKYSKRTRGGRDPANACLETENIDSAQMRLIFGGVVRTKLVEEICTSSSLPSTSKDDHNGIRRVLVIDHSPTRGQQRESLKRRDADVAVESRTKREKATQRCLKQNAHTRKLQSSKVRTRVDCDPDENNSRNDTATS